MENVRTKVLCEMIFNNTNIDSLVKENLPSKLQKSEGKLVEQLEIRLVYEFIGTFSRVYHVLEQKGLDVSYLILEEVI